MDTQKMILLVALALILMMLWQKWEEHTGANVGPGKVAGTTKKDGAQKKTGIKKASKNNEGVPGVPTGYQGTQNKGPKSSAGVSISSKTGINFCKKPWVRVRTDLIQAFIAVNGGDICRLELIKNYPVSVDKPKEPFRLLDIHEEHTFIARSGLIGLNDRYPNHNAVYKTAKYKYELKDGEKSKQVKLSWRSPKGVRYNKIYTFFRSSYVIDVSYNIENKSARIWKGFFYGLLLRNEPKEEGGFFMAMPSYTGAAIFTPTEGYDKIKFEKLADEKDLNKTLKDDKALDVTGGWVAMMQHYFVAAWIPMQDQRHQFLGGQRKDELYKIGFKGILPTQIAPGKTGSIGGRLYVGPKEHKHLQGTGVRGLPLTVDFGWLTVISEPLFRALLFINKGIGNWGWSIILLTFLIKLLFYPLSAASYKSMAKMKKLSPKMKAIKERYSGDKERERQAIMELYKTEKINPLGGCLPILIQIPVFIALYWVLLESVELRHADFMFWINDLSSKDPYFVLPVLMGASMFAQQKMSPTPMDPMQQKVFMMLPIVFTGFFLFFPAGLVLYWLVNNLLTIAQQWYINRNIEKKKT
ncbi:MAG: membrane protein insertase YidC [Gammaproteobacteria bacterium]|nr:MAG: membrane protein insertase YidC [Gammaproteobacteria bacterium]